MPAVEIRAGFEELPTSVRLAAGVSASPIKKLIGTVKTSSAVLWSGMLEMVGSALILNVKILAVRFGNCMSQRRKKIKRS